MGKETGFLEYEREDRTYRDPEERLTHYKEFVVPLSEEQLRRQAARCMNCGIPYCHNGCPVNNIIPDWNHLVYEDDWKNALDVLHSTNNFPEFTGRVCPAPCEAACTLNIVDSPVTIKSIECAIIDRGFDEGWVKPQLPEQRTGKSVAVIGSGPAGLACAQQLARAGHAVTVFEKSDRIGGLLRYGIPDFKMEKHLINRRAVQMEAEGVQFRTSSEVGVEVSFQALKENFDAVVLAGGSEEARMLDIPGSELDGVRLAMEFLTQQNKRNAGDDEVRAAPRGSLTATGKHVIVIGGGDTAMDCVRTSIRQGATSVKCLYRRDRANMPGSQREVQNAEEEGVVFEWLSAPKGFVGDPVTGVVVQKMRLGAPDVSGRQAPEVIEGADYVEEADLVIMALGFEPEDLPTLWNTPELPVNRWGTVKADYITGATELDGVYAVGDIVRGASLVVWAIKDGRDCAQAILEKMGASVAIAAE